MIPFSVLDLSPIPAGSTAADAFRHSLDLAQHAEHWGYQRYWLAEHHNMPGIASAATSVVIGHVAGGTTTIRVGAGGIMLPNHAPLVIAEQFGTLESLYPGTHRPRPRPRARHRPDAPPARCAATSHGDADTFPTTSLELQRVLSPSRAGPARARRAGRRPERADLAARLEPVQRAARRRARAAVRVRLALRARLPDAGARRSIARSSGRPSALDAPYAMVGVNVFAADTDDEARRLFTSLQQQFINLRRGTPGPLPPPVDDMDGAVVAGGAGAGVEQRSRARSSARPTRCDAGLEALHRADAARTS